MANLLAVHSDGDSNGGMRDTGQAASRQVLDDVAARARAQMQAENFPVALRVLPRAVRDQLTRVYAFARFVDDVGDEAAGDRSALLALVRDDVQAQHGGRPSSLDPVRGLDRVFAGGVPEQPFLDLVAANELDQRVDRYETFDDLLDYCALSAAPVGRIVLHLAGAATPANIADSDVVCSALQVLEHCQDVREDALAGRVYLPAGQLRDAGLTDDDLPEALTIDRTPAAVRLVVTDQVARARRMLDDGAPLVGRLSGWARLAVAGFIAGGLATADELAIEHFDVQARDIRPSKARTARHAGRLLCTRWR